MFPASLLLRFLSSPSSVQMGVARRVLKFLKGTVADSIWYKRGAEIKLIGFSYSDWPRSIDDMKSTSKYIFMLSSGAICWNLRKQQVVAQSTAEVEYVAIAITAAANQAIWLRNCY